MNQKQIEQMFEGRWRMKGDSTLTTLLEAIDGKLTLQELSVRIASLCRDFFEAGILLGKGSEVVATSPAGFEEFWNLYDKKVGRTKAEKLWAKLSEKEKADCMAYIPLYKQAQSDKQFRKNPETFLRNKAFYDEIIIRDSKDQQRSQRIAEAANLVAKYTGADKGTKG